jgi:Ser/Thr protein kinase RdoA (MazF antagonist)
MNSSIADQREVRSASEVPLLGGRVTAGIVRIGDTVRRPPRMNAEFVHALLAHLAAAGFEGAPRFLGTDELGRDVLSYIDGDVPTDLGWHDDGVLVAAARLIRKFHDATVLLVTPQTAAPTPLEVVCHNDLSPCNFVFRGDVPVAMIDFDTVAPGTRRMDLGYAAWLWLDLGNTEITAEEQRRRFRLFVAAYGDAISLAPIKEAIVYRQQLLVAEGECTDRTAMAQWARGCRAWTLENL